MNEITLSPPADATEWARYHDIRRRVLFEARGRAYIENYPDEHRQDLHPMVLRVDGRIVGTVRIDIHRDLRLAYLRLVAVDVPDQRKGHGTAMVQLAEAFVRQQGCDLVRIVSARDAAAFYHRLGYESVPDAPENSPVNLVLTKRLTGNGG